MEMYSNDGTFCGAGNQVASRLATFGWRGGAQILRHIQAFFLLGATIVNAQQSRGSCGVWLR